MIKKSFPFASFDFEGVFGRHPTGKILSVVFYLKGVYFECKFWIFWFAIADAEN